MSARDLYRLDDSECKVCFAGLTHIDGTAAQMLPGVLENFVHALPQATSPGISGKVAPRRAAFLTHEYVTAA